MAIEGPLAELGIHDVFQLLDLSRKTGTLVVTSMLRDNEGVVLFENGKVISAAIRSNPHRIGDLLVRSGRLTDADLARVRDAQDKGDRRRFGEILVAMGMVTAREMERQMRLQIEAVVFELMSWSEGHFRFEEGLSEDALRDASAPLSTESLLMEGARRIDEWSRIADRVPNLSVIPDFAPMDAEHPGLIDLLPQEWKVLAAVDGTLDIRGLAATVSMSEFDDADAATHAAERPQAGRRSVPARCAQRRHRHVECVPRSPADVPGRREHQGCGRGGLALARDPRPRGAA